MSSVMRLDSWPALVTAAVCVLVPGCDSGTSPAGSPHTPGPRSLVVRHDFGSVRHGEIARQDIAIPLPDARAPLIPIAFQRDCVCAKHVFSIVDAAGNERLTVGQPYSRFAVGDGEKLVLRLELHTSEKEAADRDKIAVRGQIVLQEDHPEHRRYFVPVQFEFAIDAPLSIEPYAHLDLGDMPRSVRFAQTFRVRADAGVLELSDVEVLEMDPAAPDSLRPVADCEVSLDRENEITRVTVAFRSGSERLDGPFAFEVVAKTNLPNDYRFRLPVSGRVIGDIEISPPEQFSFGLLDFSRPNEQMLVITDHDPRRDPDFVVHSIVDADGEDLSKHFSVEFVEVPTKSRSRHITLRYNGSLADRKAFRGLLHLAKIEGDVPLSSIPFVGFHRTP